MEITITGSAFDTGTALRTHIQEKLALVTKKVKKDAIHKIHVVINKEGIDFSCRIDVIEEIDGKAFISASNHATDVYACADICIKKLEDQLVRHNKKVLTQMKHEGVILKQEINAPGLELPEEVYEVLGDDDEEEDETLEFEGEKKEINEFKE